jgi:metal-sulfur cluster biosynthetic enzyme
MAIAEETVYEALRDVMDPELFVNIVDLGLIYEVIVEDVDGGSDVTVKMTMTTPACPAGPELVQEVRDVLLDIDGVEDVEVEVVMTPPWTPDRMTEKARDELGMY